MDKKTKILAGVFGAMVLYIMVSKSVYPWWIEPLVTLSDRVARRTEDLDKLERKQEEVEWAVRDYRRMMDRMGSGDVRKVENALRQRINTLFASHKLQEAATTPSKPHADRKTGVTKMSLTVTAVGSLASVTSFLEDLSELPQLVRVGSASIFPKNSSRRGKQSSREQVNLRVPLEVWVLPQHQMLGKKVLDADLDQPEKVVRHLGRDYSSISKRTPFTEFIPYDPLIAMAGSNQSVVVGTKLTLGGSAKGGDGKYIFEWTGDPGLSAGDTNRPTINTSKVGTFHYALQVSDDSGHVSTAQVTVDVKEKPVAVAVAPTPVTPTQPPPPPPPVVKRRTRWPDGKQMTIQVALVRNRVQERTGEIQVYNAKRRERSYYATGDELDGGTLVFVHPRAALVRWEDEFYVYPVGANISDDLQLADASEYPRFQSLAEQILADEKAAAIVPVEVPVEVPVAVPDADSKGEAVPAAGDSSKDVSRDADLAGAPTPTVKPAQVAKPAVGVPVQQYAGRGDAAGLAPVAVPTKSGETEVVPAAPVKSGKPAVMPSNTDGVSKTGEANKTGEASKAGAADKPQANTVKKRPPYVKQSPNRGRRTKKFGKRRGNR